MSARVYKVLLVDDSEVIRRALRKSYEAIGFAVVGEAENGSAAIALAIKHRPDLIVLDVAMPIMNGLQATPELLRALPKAIIILFTLHGDSSFIKDRARALGIRSVVPKSNLASLISESEALTRDLE